MIIGFAAPTGSGKSYFSKRIAQIFGKNYGAKYLPLVSTREPRKGESANSCDKIFVSEKQFKQMQEKEIIAGTFEMLGYWYGYETEKLKSDSLYITEIQYDQVDSFRQITKDSFLIYLMPTDLEIPKNKLKLRGLPKQIEEARLTDIDNHIREFSENNLAQKYDCVLANDYTEETMETVEDIVKHVLEKNRIIKAVACLVIDESGNVIVKKKESNTGKVSVFSTIVKEEEIPMQSALRSIPGLEPEEIADRIQKVTSFDTKNSDRKVQIHLYCLKIKEEEKNRLKNNCKIDEISLETFLEKLQMGKTTFPKAQYDKQVENIKDTLFVKDNVLYKEMEY